MPVQRLYIYIQIKYPLALRESGKRMLATHSVLGTINRSYLVGFGLERFEVIV